MCHSGIVIWFVLGAILITAAALIGKRLGLVKLARLGHALSVAVVVGGIVAQASGDVDCVGLCYAVNMGLYSWWLAFAVGCWC